MSRIHEEGLIEIGTEPVEICPYMDDCKAMVVQNVGDPDEDDGHGAAQLGSATVTPDTGIYFPKGAIVTFSGDEMPDRLYAVASGTAPAALSVTCVVGIRGDG